MSQLVTSRVKPVGFAYVPGEVFSCSGPGLALHNFDAATLFDQTYSNQLSVGEVFIDPNGSDSNNGQLNSPMRTIEAASAIPNVGRIWVKPGVYTDRFMVRGSTMLAGGQARPIRIEAWGGPGTVTWRAPGAQPSDMNWTASGMAFQATPPGGEFVNHIVFREDGREIHIQFFPSAAQVMDVASGWSQDPVSKQITVRHENRNFLSPSERGRLEIMYLRPVNHVIYGATVFLRHINFRADNQLLVMPEGQLRPTIYAKNCAFQYLAYHNVQLFGALSLFQECTSENSLGGDGWNYYEDTENGRSCQAVEVDCIGRNNGIPQYRDFDGYRNKQGSSGHGNSVICRINGVYERNYGQAIADTGTGSRTWMVGSKLSTSRHPVPINMTQQGAAGTLYIEGTAWLDHVQGSDQTWPMGLWVDGTAYLNECLFSGAAGSIGGPGPKLEFDPFAP